MSQSLEHARTTSPEIDVRLAISEIAALKSKTALKFALTVGEIVVRRIFNGDIKKLRRRGPKDVAICRLAEHPELPISVSSLYVAVQVYELSNRIGDLHTCGDLQLSHFKAVLAQPEDKQRDYLTRAAKEMWSVSRLRREIEHGSSPRPLAAHRPAARPDYSRTLQAIVRYAEFIECANAAEVAASLELAELERAAAGAQWLAAFTAECLARLPSLDGAGPASAGPRAE